MLAAGLTIARQDGSGTLVVDDLRRHRWISNYCHALWGSQAGWACVCEGRDGQFTKTGTYKMDWREKHYRWPAQAEQIVSHVLEGSDQHDMYVGVLLHEGARRKKGTACPGRFAWADVDHDLTGAQKEVLGHMLAAALGSFVVHSGRGRHVYLDLGNDNTPDDLQGWNRRLGRTLEADNKWSETTVLRPPGTFWHKGRAVGGDSRLVKWWIP